MAESDLMSSAFATLMLWTAALSSGLIAGVYFAFSAFIMQAFARLETEQSVAAMNSINEIILRSLFMPLFFGSTFVSLMLVVIALMHWGEEGSGLTLTAGAVYFIGMFICTVVFNVPLNNRLAGMQGRSVDAGPVWTRYLTTWTGWNHVRTVSSLATCILSIWVLSTP
jgi:uncharacterized membrane protein